MEADGDLDRAAWPLGIQQRKAATASCVAADE